jgi:hypothetical protein
MLLLLPGDESSPIETTTLVHMVYTPQAISKAAAVFEVTIKKDHGTSESKRRSKIENNTGPWKRAIENE